MQNSLNMNFANIKILRIENKTSLTLSLNFDLIFWRTSFITHKKDRQNFVAFQTIFNLF